jgi:hypothetical protein
MSCQPGTPGESSLVVEVFAQPDAVKGIGRPSAGQSDSWAGPADSQSPHGGRVKGSVKVAPSSGLLRMVRAS